MAESIGRANIEVGADLSPLDAGLAEAQNKVKAAVQAAPAAQSATTSGDDSERYQQRLQEMAAAQAMERREILRNAEASEQKADAVDKVADATKRVNVESEKAKSSGGFLGLGNIAQLATGIGSLISSVTALWNGFKNAANAARDLANEIRAIGDAFSANKQQFMGDLTKQIEQSKEALRIQRDMAEQGRLTFQGFIDHYISADAEYKIKVQQIQNEFNASIARAQREETLRIKRQIAELRLELRKFREDINATSGIGNQAIELTAVSEAMKILALKSEASR